VGNPEFCAFYASQSIPSELYVNGADPIAKLLPIKEYAHVCATIHIGEQDLSPNLPLLIDLPEHDMACYLESMQNPDSIKKENSFILFLKRMQRWIFILISNYE
jgi:hypothetical protein